MTVAFDERLAAFATEHYGVFARRHLDDLGCTDRQRKHRLDQGRWVPVHDDVYMIGGTPPLWEGSVLAGVWASGERGFASHQTAAEIWGLPGGRRSPVEITCPRWRRARHDSLLVHESTRLGDIDVTTRRGIPCTTIERTLFDLAGVVGARTIELAIDEALRRELTTFGALVATRDRLAKRGRRGAAGFRRVLDDRDPFAALPESAPERLLAHLLVRSGLPAPVPQFVVSDESGLFVARVDLAYPAQRLALEYDSVQEHTGKAALFRDSARRNRLVAIGWTELSATAADLHDGANFVRSVRQFLELASRSDV